MDKEDKDLKNTKDIEIENKNPDNSLNKNPNEEKPKKEKMSFDEFSEKVEDTVEDVMITIDETVYGNSHDFTHDIPAMMEMPDKPRKINKIQTRRNIMNRLLGTKGKLILLAIIGCAMIIGLIVALIEL